ncbi:aminoglycoside phosphotransferase family protein [Streptomyces cucumeris]|uniref:aminoglycoside phosphotransferase family protein n=1 Tax=Streptomyces cucumeris TaxID=2962890 RepID=UPI003D7218B0
MPTAQTYADEPDAEISRVRRAIAAQFPRWAGLPLEPVARVSTSNTMYRLGEDKVVRFPRAAGSAADIAREHTWLPRLAPALPVAVPVPLGKGAPMEGFPWPWSVYRWLDGENPVPGRITEPGWFAEDMAGFITALRRIDATDAPPSYRSEHLAARDGATRSALRKVRAEIDAHAATAAWDTALRAPVWQDPPVLVHADLQPGNLLLDGGRLSGVIDFECLGLGDPAVDLIVAWYVLPAGARDAFRTAVAADDAAWARGRGWALSVALVELASYRDTNSVMAATARHVIGEVLADGEHTR